MVCAKCESKVASLAVADKWRAGEVAGRKPGGGGATGAMHTCRACKAVIHMPGANYCQQCAYRNGICAMCGVRVLDTALYQMSGR